MPYAVEAASARVLKELEALPRDARERVIRRIESLADDPRSGCEKLEGEKGAYRVRVGDYRIVYEVDDQLDVVTITRVAHRREIYDRL